MVFGYNSEIISTIPSDFTTPYLTKHPLSFIISHGMALK